MVFTAPPPQMLVLAKAVGGDLIALCLTERWQSARDVVEAFLSPLSPRQVQEGPKSVLEGLPFSPQGGPP